MSAMLHVVSRRIENDTLELAATLQGQRVNQRVWWQIPAPWSHAVTPWMDPFVVGLIFPMMMAGEGVHIAGRVSPSLLANLETFMAVWQTWQPERYRAVRFHADEEIESPAPETGAGKLLPFSGGVDSSFTAFRHVRTLAGRGSQKIDSALVISGFDLKPHEAEKTATIQKSARHMLASLNVPLMEVRTNLQSLPLAWEDIHSSVLASGLLLFSGRYNGALIANAIPVSQLGTRWGSHPFTDLLLGSKNFPIADDGAEFTRWQKLQLLAQWPEAQQHMRVCFAKPAAEGGFRTNCSRCEKCLRTILSARVAGVPVPATFTDDVTPAHIRRVRLGDALLLGFWQELLPALASHPVTPWSRATRRLIRRHVRRKLVKAWMRGFVPYRNRFRRLFRGSEVSRRTLRERQALAGPNTSSPS